jgi:hypothetical protein
MIASAKRVGESSLAATWKDLIATNEQICDKTERRLGAQVITEATQNENAAKAKVKRTRCKRDHHAGLP